MENQKKAIIIVGPTAVGKTAVSIGVAAALGTEIISADSRQCYQELNIGVARPSQKELQTVPHHFIASHSILAPLNAGSYEQLSVQKAAEIFRQHDSLVVVGGTGLYIRAFCEGLDEIPAADPDVRAAVMHGYEQQGIEWLRAQVKEKDPAFYEQGEIKNPQRLMRALEVVLATGKSILSYRGRPPKKRAFRMEKWGLQLPREKLVQHISKRVRQMLDQGLVEEVRSLMPFRDRGPLQTVGYAEIFEYLDGRCSLEEAVSRIETHTWQYAKRQYTWFRKDPAVRWIEADRAEVIRAMLGPRI